MTRFLNRFAILALVVTAGCETSVPKSLPPLDPASASFYFPTGMAVKTLPSGTPALLVVSSNFDLQYDHATGGTLLAVDPDQSQNSLPVCDPNNSALKTCCDSTKDSCGNTLSILGNGQGAARMGSFGGEVAFADTNNCSQLSLSTNEVARVVTVSRSENSAYWMTMKADGSLDCGGGTGCAIPLVNTNTQLANTQTGDAYGVTIACSSTGGAPDSNGNLTPQASAFITHLRAVNDEGWVSEVSLASSKVVEFQDLGATGDSYSSAYDPGSARLYVTSQFGSIGTTPLRWLDFATPLLLPLPSLPQVPTRQVNQFNLYAELHGSLTRSLALSNDGTRGYLAVQLYDPTLASSTGSVSVFAALLAVLDLQPDPSGAPSFKVLNTVPIPAGPSQVKVLPQRTGMKDLVAVTCTDDGVLALYDDEVGAPILTATIGLDQNTGNPVLGKQPFGLAVESRATGCKLTGSGCDRLYVGSFDRGWVNIVEVNPDNPSQGWNSPTGSNACTTQANCPALVRRIGRERQ